MRVKSRSIAIVLAAVGLLLAPAAAWAANTPTLNQTVNAGTLSSDIFQSDGTTPVAAPTVGFDAVTKSLSCQTSAKVLGDTNNRLYVTNLATNSGWTLTMAATGGASALWTGATYTYDYNDPADNTAGDGAGCANGQLTVDPSVATVTLDCSGNCTATGVSKGSSTAFSSGTSSVTLMSDANGDAWRGYLTGINLSQTIPDGQDADVYSLPMTITVTGV